MLIKGTAFPSIHRSINFGWNLIQKFFNSFFLHLGKDIKFKELLLVLFDLQSNADLVVFCRVLSHFLFYF
jgi:hypothetical protein